MELREIFERERERYVSFLVQARDRVAELHPPAAGEVLISINTETIPYPYRYLRVDVLSKASDDSPQPHEVRIDLDPNFEPRGFDFGGVVVEVYPFTWNDVQVVVDSPFPDIGKIEGWITRWLDVEDTNSRDALELSQSVHSFSQVGHNDSWWYLTGDFGSAPADALLEFVELLAEQGIKRIIIKSVQENA